MTVHRDNLRVNNQQDASSIQNFCHETLHVSGIYCAHYQELSAVHVAIGMFHAGYVAAAKDSQVSGWNLTLLGRGDVKGAIHSQLN